MPSCSNHLLKPPCFLLCAFLGSLLTLALASQIPLGSKLSVVDNNSWVSSNGDFAVGFFEHPDQPSQYSVGIYCNSNLIPVDKQAVVWVAGAEIVVGNGSYFQLTHDGELVLFDSMSGAFAWTSRTSNLSVSSASLQNNGNLVLLNGQNDVLWKSFDTPTDSLLPGQNLSTPQILRAFKDGSRSSYYSLYMTSLGQLQLKWEYNVTYWTSGNPLGQNLSAALSNGGSFELLNEAGRPAWSVYASDWNDVGVRYRLLRLDVDGNLRIYSWVENTGWRRVWQAIENQCEVFATCGLKGVCVFNDSGSPVCKCPFESSTVDCLAPYDQGCDNKASMLTYEHSFLYGIYPPNNSFIIVNLEKCMELCLHDPFCTAVAFSNDGTAQCRLQTSRYITGYSDPSLVSMSFAKICADPMAVLPSNPHAASTAHPRSSPGLSIACFVGASIGTFCIVAVAQIMVGFWVYKRRKPRERKTDFPDPGLQAAGLIEYTYNEIQEITGKFTHQIGQDFFKGALQNNHQVAVKHLNASFEEKRLHGILLVTGSISHKNIAKLEGYCFEKGHNFLVYEFLRNGSLEKGLHDQKLGNQLTWRKRMNICRCVARAISYLHYQCRDFIPHGNLSCENVMLDENLEAKVTCYGTGIALAASEGAPADGGPAERDVKDFSQLVLSLISGRTNNIEGFAEWLYEKWLDGEATNLVDERIRGDEVDTEELERTLRLGFWCLQWNERLRPSMSEVVKIIEGTLSIDLPPCPFEPPRSGDVKASESSKSN